MSRLPVARTRLERSLAGRPTIDLEGIQAVDVGGDDVVAGEEGAPVGGQLVLGGERVRDAVLDRAAAGAAALDLEPGPTGVDVGPGADLEPRRP